MKIKYPAILALFAQVISAIIIFGIYFKFSLNFNLFFAGVLQGILAAVIGKKIQLKRWWMIINLFFVPALIFFNTFQIPRWSFLVGFFVILLLNWNSLKERVPLYLTGNKTQELLAGILKNNKQGFSFVDLGSGLAGTLYYLSKQFPESHFYGVETAPLVFFISWLRCIFRKNCHLKYRSIWSENLSQYDVVYCFLSPVPMPEIWKKAKSEMKKGSLLISNTFEIPDVPPTDTIKLHDWRDSQIIIWKI
jgi:hypothetical protein